jgi:hypothetical protein
MFPTWRLWDSDMGSICIWFDRIPGEEVGPTHRVKAHQFHPSSAEHNRTWREIANRLVRRP